MSIRAVLRLWPFQVLHSWFSFFFWDFRWCLMSNHFRIFIKSNTNWIGSSKNEIDLIFFFSKKGAYQRMFFLGLKLSSGFKKKEKKMCWLKDIDKISIIVLFCDKSNRKFDNRRTVEFENYLPLIGVLSLYLWDTLSSRSRLPSSYFSPHSSSTSKLLKS